MPTHRLPSTVIGPGILALAITVALGGCAQRLAPQLDPIRAAVPASASAAPNSPIQHVIIVIQENRTFDNFFATYPGADGTTSGFMLVQGKNGKLSRKRVTLKEGNLILPSDLSHAYESFRTALDGGKMDGFSLVKFGSGIPEKTYPYQYVNPAQIKPYWSIAKQYVLGDHMFQTQGSSSFTAHQDLIAGNTEINSHESLIDLPTHTPWGCDAPQDTITHLVNEKGVWIKNGPFPCLDYPTIRDLLDQKQVSWKYYSPPLYGYGGLWSAFDAIRAVRYSSEWSTNVIRTSEKQIFTDISTGNLADVSWVVPDGANSDHPGYTSDTGPSWVAQIVNAVGRSKYWNSSAVVITWDDWGGLYDHVPPRQLYYDGLGFRVPLLVVSPYVPTGRVSHTRYEFGSILRFIEQNWRLGALHRNDVGVNSIRNVFDFKQPPRPFSTIRAKYSQAYFMRQPPSNLPVDTDM